MEYDRHQEPARDDPRLPPVIALDTTTEDSNETFLLCSPLMRFTVASPLHVAHAQASALLGSSGADRRTFEGLRLITV